VEHAHQFQVVANDIDSLRKFLNTIGIAPTDIEELETALQEDERPTNARKLGSRVASWLGKMTQKAASGAWNMTTKSAAESLTRAILAYYGLGP
jgi:hypothetical protein